MTQRKFTLQEGLEIQAHQLDKWATVLKPEVFDWIRAYVHAKNAALAENIKQIGTMGQDQLGHSVFRGGDIDDLVLNYQIRREQEGQSL